MKWSEKMKAEFGKATRVPLIPLRDRASDERVIAMHRWFGPTKAPKPQEPCDHGLFGDAHRQQELKL